MQSRPERQTPFNHSKCGIPVSQKLDPEVFSKELTRIPSEERMALVRAWVQDRSPAAFAEKPYLWEAVREWIAKRYTLSPRQIGLAGSAQIGFSTNPQKAYLPFDKNGSDLDLYIVSDVLYATLEREARKFIVEYIDSPSSRYFAQAQTTQRAIRNEYVNVQQIPADRDKYPTCQNLLNDASIIIDKLKLSEYNLKPSHFRIYKDWGAKAKWTNVQADSWAKKLPAYHGKKDAGSSALGL